MFLRREHLAALVVAVSLTAVSGPARAQTTPTHFTPHHIIHFSAGTDQDRKVLSAIPSARDIVAQPFEIAREDLNDDGLEEVILMGTSSYWCGSGGCAVVVLDNRNGKAVPIRANQNLYSPLVVTNEKIGEYRALATVDDKGVIASGDRPGTPMSGKQLVYAMKDYETAAQAGPPPKLSSKSPLDGTYAYTEPTLGGHFIYTFKSNGHVTVSVMGQEAEMRYKVNGNTVRITNPQLPAAGTQVLTLLEDGALQFGTGLKLTKQKKLDSSNSETFGTSSGDGGDARQLSAVEREARDAVVAKVETHWVKRPDGWVTLNTAVNPNWPENPPDHYFAQVRELVVQDVEPSELSESDKMNGFEWVGAVRFKKTPYRETGDPGPIKHGTGAPTLRQRGVWSQWFDYAPEPVPVQKVKGKWQITRGSSLLDGDLPGFPSSSKESGQAPTPSFPLAWGDPGTGNGQFSRISDVSLDAAGNVYVTEASVGVDLTPNRIQKFTSTGTYLTQWGTTGTGNGQFDHPEGVAIDAAGNVYVADSGNNRIQKFTSTGAYLTRWGTSGRGDGQFLRPRSVAIDAVGNVYVADSYNHRIQKFTSTGAYLTQWGSLGPGSGQFLRPSGVAVDGSGNVYVVDEAVNRIQKFTSAGLYITQWGTSGRGDGQFLQATGVAVDGSGNVYVVDEAVNRIQKFTSTGAYLTQWGTRGAGSGEFNNPGGIAVDASGNVYVGDDGNYRIQEFTRQ